MSGQGIDEAIACYHALLEKSSRLAEESAAILAQRQPQTHLTFGDKSLCHVLRPHFLAPATYQRIQQVCSLLSTAMFRLAEQMPQHPELLAPLHLTPVEQELVA